MPNNNKLHNSWVVIKEEFDIAGIIFPKGETGVCTFQGNKGFLVVFDTFKIENSMKKEQDFVTFANDYEDFFEVLEKFEKPWYEMPQFNKRNSKFKM